MAQFGGAPRNDDYDFFTAPARPAATSGFGGGPAAGGQFGGPPAPRHAPATPPPGASRGRKGVLLPVVLAAVLVLGVAGVAAAQGKIPGLGGADGAAPGSAAPPSPYTAKPPKKLPGLTLSDGSKAKQIAAAFRSGGGFADHPVTTFVYVDTHHAVRVYGGVVLAAMTAQDQRAFMAGATSSLSADGQGIAIGKLKPVRPGSLGGSMRCARLGTVPASTECVFTDRGSGGVVVVMGRTGAAAVSRARSTREAVVHRH